MKLSNIAKLTIIFGIAVIIFALNTSVSLGGSNLVNIHLLNRQQNFLILGGIIFISGIILFATFKIKESKQEKDALETNSAERMQRVYSKIVQLWSLIKVYKKLLRAF